jgi:hypothetical protein
MLKSLTFAAYNVSTAGFFGVILYGIFSCLCIWRVIVSYIKIQNIFDLKLLFHITLALNGLFEFTYFLSMLLFDEYENILVLYFYMTDY